MSGFLPGLEDWYKVLSNAIHYSWLQPLKSDQNKKLAVLGAIDGHQVFILAGLLVISEAIIIDISTLNQDWFNSVHAKFASLLEEIGCKITYMKSDIAEPLQNLPSNHYDVAYCQNMLYYMTEESGKTQGTIQEMVRIIRPGGVIIVDEETLTENIDNQFLGLGLVKFNLENAPENAYCYRKL